MTVDNGVSQRSMIKSILFSIMINDKYKLDITVGKSAFADDGALWKLNGDRREINGNVIYWIIKINHRL